MRFSHAAPASSNIGRFVLDFDESWNAWGPYDWCCFSNTGGDLEDCTVIVEIKGTSGQIRTNVHFVRRWQGNSSLFSRYDSGLQLPDRTVCRTTVPNVETVNVRVLSPQFSTEVRYQYAGVEKSKDMSRRIEEIKLHIQGLVRDSAFGAKSGKVFILENRFGFPVYQVGIRVTSATGATVVEFVKPRLDPQSKMDVGSLQVSRNLVSGDRVAVWIGGEALFTKVVPCAMTPSASEGRIEGTEAVVPPETMVAIFRV